MKMKTTPWPLPDLLFILLFVLQGGKSPVTFALWGALALAWAFHSLYKTLPTKSAMLYYTGWIVLLGLSQLFSVHPQGSLPLTIQIMTLATVGLALSVCPRTDEETFWNALKGIAIISSVFTCYQLFLRIPSYGGLPINPNFNAVLLSAGAVGLLSRPKPRRLEVIFSLFLTALVVLACSRSALLGLFVGLTYAAQRRFRWRMILTVDAMIFLVVILFFRVWAIDQWQALRSDARLDIWHVAWQAFRDHPVWGWGAGNFEHAYFRHAFATTEIVRFANSTEFAHCDFLQVLSEFGSAGAAMTLYGLTRFIQPRKLKASEVPYAAMLMTLSCASLFNSILRMPLFLFLALYWLLRWRRDETPADAERPLPSPRFRALLLMALLILSSVLIGCGIRSAWARQGQWNRILRWHSRDAEALHGAAFQSVDAQHALALHRRAVQQSPNHIYYVESLARQLESLPGDSAIPEALHYFSKAVELSPRRATNILSLARLYWRMGNFQEALRWAIQAEALEPHYFEASLWRARCQWMLKETAAAIQTLTDLQSRYQSYRTSGTRRRISPYTNSILSYNASMVSQELASYRARAHHRVQ